MKKMIATKSQKYGYKNISVGDVFSVHDNDVRILRALGRVMDVPAVKGMSAENTSALVPNPPRESRESAHESIARVEEHIEPTQQVDINDVLDNTEDNESENIEDHDNTSESNKEQEVTQSLEYSRILRERAVSLGIRVDGRWSDVRVQREIDEYNKRTYQRMDIRAVDNDK